MPNIQPTPHKCAKCNGEGFWDNRLDKKNPKAPDFKCKNKGCGEGIWLAKNAVWADTVNHSVAPQQDDSRAYNTRNSPNAPAGFAAALDGQDADERGFVRAVQLTDRLQPLFALYSACLNNAAMEAAKLELPPEVIPQMAATLYISAKERGLAA